MSNDDKNPSAQDIAIIIMIIMAAPKEPLIPRWSVSLCLLQRSKGLLMTLDDVGRRLDGIGIGNTNGNTRERQASYFGTTTFSLFISLLVFPVCCTLYVDLNVPYAEHEQLFAKKYTVMQVQFVPSDQTATRGSQ